MTSCINSNNTPINLTLTNIHNQPNNRQTTQQTPDISCPNAILNTARNALAATQIRNIHVPRLLSAATHLLFRTQPRQAIEHTLRVNWLSAKWLFCHATKLR